MTCMTWSFHEAWQGLGSQSLGQSVGRVADGWKLELELELGSRHDHSLWSVIVRVLCVYFSGVHHSFQHFKTSPYRFVHLKKRRS
jgi:hypothetical protein